MDYYYKLSLNEKISQMWKTEKLCKYLNRKMVKTKNCRPIELEFIKIFKNFKKVRQNQGLLSGSGKITEKLDQIIENSYFGSKSNRKRFYFLVDRITTQSKNEYMYKSWLANGFDLNVMQWLESENLCNDEDRRKLLEKCNVYLLKYIVKPIIRQFYHASKSYKNNGITFIERSRWQLFQDKSFHNLLKFEHLKPINGSGGPMKSRGVLRLYQKQTCDPMEFRPLMSAYKRDTISKLKFKQLSKKINALAASRIKITYHTFYSAWKKYTFNLTGNIYGIKLDIKDAFGSVDIGMVSLFIEKSSLSNDDKLFIIQHIQNQYVCFKNQMYKWNHGILQGDSLSSSICNLYLYIQEKDIIDKFCTSKDNLLLRSVDDYLFCSTDRNLINEFRVIMENRFEVNDSKTEISDGRNGSSCITYLNQIIDLTSKEVEKDYRFKRHNFFHHNFRFCSLKNPVKEQYKHIIISKTLTFPCNNYCFKKTFLNTLFNSEEKVLMNYYYGMIFIAFKFHASLITIRYFHDEVDSIPNIQNIIRKTVRSYASKVNNIIEKYKGRHHKENISYLLLKKIGYNAFLVVLKKYNEMYKPLIRSIKAKESSYMPLKNICNNPRQFKIMPSAFDDINASRKPLI